MTYQTLNVERDDRGMLTLWLNLPEKRNSLSAEMIAELTQFAETIVDDPARVVVLRGAGKVFCAGGDLNWMKAQINADRDTRMKEARKLAMMLNALNTMPKPLIGVVHGGAFGGGVGMASVCDYVIADHEAKFGLTETRLGLIPATISPYVVARMGEGAARQVFMSAEIFGASKAQSLGLVSEVSDSLDEAILRVVEPYFHTAPEAVARTKRLVRSLGAVIDDEKITQTIVALADAWESGEALQGIDAFFAKTPPPWDH